MTALNRKEKRYGAGKDTWVLEQTWLETGPHRTGETV